jgi:5-carboxymethyl-2-hydroxymuconate isomerase
VTEWFVSNDNRSTDKFIRSNEPHCFLLVIHRGLGKTEQQHRELCDRVCAVLNAHETEVKS